MSPRGEALTIKPLVTQMENRVCVCGLLVTLAERQCLNMRVYVLCSVLLLVAVIGVDKVQFSGDIKNNRF